MTKKPFMNKQRRFSKLGWLHFQKISKTCTDGGFLSITDDVFLS